MEEVKGLPRGRFALAGATLLLVVLAFLAILAGSAEAGLYGYGALVYVVLPSALSAFAAARVAGARSSRFVDALFTTPVTKGQFLAVQVLVSMTVGFLYLAATLPLLAVYASHGDIPEILLRFLLVGAGLVLVTTALGTFLGVLFTGRTVTAPVSLAIGSMVLFGAAVPFLQRMATEVLAGRAEALVRLAHVSPHTHLLGLAGLLGFFAPSSAGRAFAALAILTIGLILVAAWTFLRCQSVESWEAPAAARLLVLLGSVAILVAPSVVAGTAYEPVERSAAGGVSMASSGMDAALVPRGRPASEARFGFTTSDPETIPAGRGSEMDLLVRLHVDASSAVRNLTLEARSVDGRLALEGDTRLTLERLPVTEVDDRSGQAWPILRVPLTVTPTDPRALAASVYNVNVTTSYDVEGDPARSAAYADFPVFAAVPGGMVQLVAAQAPLIALGAGGAALRRARVG